MPYGDGTGPAGMGPSTGLGAGFCRGLGWPGGNRRGGGGGWRWRNRFHAGPAPGQEESLDALKSQAGFLERTLENIRKRMASFEDKPPKE